MRTDRLRQFFVLFSIISMILMNYLSNARVFGGLNNKEMSDRYHTDITPAGYAFAIWGVIFLGMLAFGVYQALPSQRHNPRFRAVGWWVVLNAWCNAIWSPLFNNERIGTALLVILVMLFTLVVIEHTLLARPNAPLVAPDADATLPEVRTSTAETWLARIPFSIYFGWLTVATILNTAVYLKASQVDLSGLMESGWAAVILVVGIVVGTFLFNRFRSVAFILVFVWAYLAIAAEQRGIGNVPGFAYAGAAVALLLVVLGLLNKKVPTYA